MLVRYRADRSDLLSKAIEGPQGAAQDCPPGARQVAGAATGGGERGLPEEPGPGWSAVPSVSTANTWSPTEINRKCPQA